MSSRLFAKMIDQYAPKVNVAVMEGLACTAMQYVEKYIDSVFRSASRSFPECLSYIGYERCTPEEEYREVSKARNSKRTFDIAKSDVYLVKYFFKYYEENLPIVYVYLPFVRDAGIMYLNGSPYHITPVLSDKVISPGYDTVFVRLLRDRIIFKRLYHNLVVNGIRETTYVIWSQIHRKSGDKKVDITTKAETCLAHYLFAQFGFTETFTRYAGFVPIVGNEEITEELYPKDKYVICSSGQIKPKTFIGGFYNPTTIRLAIPLEYWTPMTKSLVVGLFYILDHFPERIKKTYLDNTNLWKILLGHIIFSGNYGENKLFQSVSEHFTSLDDYVDTMIVEKLHESGYNVNNFYDLIALMSEKFNDLVLDIENVTLSMYGKSLEVLYYVLYDITSGIFKVNFGLGKLVPKKALTKDDTKETLNKFVKPRAVLNLASGKIITESVSYSGDHKYPKLTSKITEQESLPGATRGKSKRHVLGADKHIDTSMLECGSILFLPKSNPTPANKINPYITIDLATGTVLPNPKLEKLREQLANQLKGGLEKSE